MPITFVDLAQTCAPAIAVETLAGVVSLESRFQPYSIRIGARKLMSKEPTTKAEAIATASALIAGGQDVLIGLGGIRSGELGKLKLSIAEAFDPCLNLQATAQLLDGYYRLAVRAGADADQAARVMLQSYYGRVDPTTTAMADYDRKVEQQVQSFSTTLATLTINQGADEQVDTIEADESDSTPKLEAEPQASQTVNAPSWDVFNAGRRSSLLIFQNNRSE